MFLRSKQTEFNQVVEGWKKITTEVVFQFLSLTTSITRAVNSTRITVTTVTSHATTNAGY